VNEILKKWTESLGTSFCNHVVIVVYHFSDEIQIQMSIAPFSTIIS